MPAPVHGNRWEIICSSCSFVRLMNTLANGLAMICRGGRYPIRWGGCTPPSPGTCSTTVTALADAADIGLLAGPMAMRIGIPWRTPPPPDPGAGPDRPFATPSIDSYAIPFVYDDRFRYCHWCAQGTSGLGPPITGPMQLIIAIPHPAGRLVDGKGKPTGAPGKPDSCMREHASRK
jgi:hypothetical protein